eukprot:g5505.t1
MADASAAAAPNLPEGSSLPADGDGEDAAASPTLTLNIKTLNGPDFELLVGRDEPVSEMKTKVRQHTNVDEARQRLIYRGKVLADTEPLSAYKVEDGHFVHMVARPEGVPAAAPPAAAGAGAGALREELRNQVADRNADIPGLEAEVAEAERIFGHGGGLSDRLLMGMGGGGGGGGTRGRDAFLNAAAGQEQGDFLSNMLPSQRRDGGGGGGGGGRVGQADTALPRRSVRGQGTGGGGRAADHGDLRHHDGQDAPADDVGTNLEHVRQGLLTLHTLLSGIASRRRQELAPESPVEASAPPTEPFSTEAATGSNTEADVTGDSQPTPTTAATAEADAAGVSTVPTRGGVVSGSGSESGSESETDEPVVAGNPGEGRASMTAAAQPGTTQQQQPQVQVQEQEHLEEEGVAGPETTASTNDPCLVSGNDGSSVGRAMLPAASFDDDSEGEGEGEREREGGKDGGEAAGEKVGEVDQGSGGETRGEKDQDSDRQSRRNFRSGSESGSDASAPSLRWPVVGHGDMARTESGSASSEGPPRLVSDSGESEGSDDYDQYERGHRRRGLAGRGWSRGFLRDSRDSMEQEDEEEEEEEHEECKEDGSPSGRRRQRLKRRFFVGQWLDVKDTVNNWLEATVMDMTSSGSRLQIHYNGWPSRWDEWLSWDSPRIAPFRTKTQHLPQAQHVSPAPISAVRNAPRTGPLVDDVRVLLPEVQHVLQEIGPMVDELSTCYAKHLEQDPSTSPTGGRAVSHTLPWTRRRVQQQPERRRQGGNTTTVSGGGAAASTADATAAAATATPEDDPEGLSKAADLAGDIAPLFDRLGRMLTDVAPHLARLSESENVAGAAAAEREDAPEPGELPWGSADPLRRSGGRVGRGGGGGGRGGGGGGSSGRGRGRGRGRGELESVAEEPASAFRQLVSTSSPAPTSSNINIHIHAIVPLRGPPSPPPPPPPPPPTASASAVATPTRAERPPLATGGNRQNSSRPWNANTNGDGLDAAGGSAASLVAAARLATFSRVAAAAAAASTPSARGGGGAGGDSGSETEGGSRASSRIGGGGGGAAFPADLAREGSSPLTVATPGSLTASSRAALPSTLSSSGGGGGIAAAAATATAATGSSSFDRAGFSNPASAASISTSDSGHGHDHGHGHGHGHGHRRGGGWRGLLRAFGLGGNGGSSRVSGRRDGDGASGGGGAEDSDQSVG